MKTCKHCLGHIVQDPENNQWIHVTTLKRMCEGSYNLAYPREPRSQWDRIT